jgi:integrase
VSYSVFGSFRRPVVGKRLNERSQPPPLLDGVLLVFANCTRHPLRNRVIVLLAAKAGLRAVEIANLTWDMVLDPTGGIGPVIELRDAAAKNGSGRLIPVHPLFGRPSLRIAIFQPALDLSSDPSAAEAL